MERVLVIAGGAWQAPLVKKIKDMGYEAVNSNLYEDSPGFEFADYHEVADVLDRERNLEIAEKYQVNAVLTDESDIAVPTVAYVAQKLGLPTIGEDKAELFTNKYRMREFCETHGLKTPEFRLCRSAQEVAAFMRRIGKKVIIKPLDAQSSRGIFILEREEDAFRYFQESVCHSRTMEAVIAERFLEGTEFTVDGIVLHGQHHSLAISEKKHYAYNASIASELFFSHTNPRFDYEKLRSVNDRFVQLARLPFGLTHAEYKYEDGEFYLIEIAARGGGTRISSHIVPLMTGIDNYRILIETALGHQENTEWTGIDTSSGRCAVLKFFDVEADGSAVKEIRGEEEIRNNPAVVELHLEFHAGDRLFKATDDRSRIGFYIAAGDSREELLATMRWVEDTLQIITEDQ